MNEILLAVVAILGHLILGGYIIRAFLIHFVPDDEPQPIRPNIKRVL